MNKNKEKAIEEYNQWKNKKIIAEYGITDEGKIVPSSDLEGGSEDGEK